MRSLVIFDGLSKFIGVFVVLFTVLIFIYSLAFIKRRRFYYYFWFILTFLASLGVVFSSNFVLILIFWGFLGLSLFSLINLDRTSQQADTAKKTFIIVGGSDAFLLLGFLILTYLSGSIDFSGNKLEINSLLSLFSFLFIGIGCFAKAGLMPFHTWIPDVSQHAPLPVVAYLPASIDKLLGIYLLARVIKDVFILNGLAKVILIFLGGFTVISAVMMALIQHNIRRLLGFHAISQVGYMVLGLGCGSILGLAGGLFHMLNNALYKACLFLTAGNVEEKTGSSELEDLGGLAKFMPLTFLGGLISALSISGIPPLNGFVSKWIVYQALIDLVGNSSGSLKIVGSLGLVFALVGSGLTLASFLKFLGGVFLGKSKKKVKEGNFFLLFPVLVLAGFCVIFGIFFRETVLNIFLKPYLGEIKIYGLWEASLATLLIIFGLVLGLLIFFIFSLKKKFRQDNLFVGGEEEEAQPLVSDFYTSFRKMRFLAPVYDKACQGFFDIYQVLKKITFSFANFLKYLHNGVLPTYLVWCLLGVLGLFLAFFRF
ncbi:MAG: hypothetical protein DRP61_02295 [Candidatus Omnitrophota bacterium]|nr:MAG: hypothetical protein DRP61_02295 [Candidatus Omnitrophota bacterium]RKY35727.1 MAG: hypothetical protein DRP69_00500 [Candidatus Omnitrophota bacterium]RKY44582.1 MAG: hypothetical protein DRP80_01925 [Candidatus Omnitrophota bacterium]